MMALHVHAESGCAKCKHAERHSAEYWHFDASRCRILTCWTSQCRISTCRCATVPNIDMLNVTVPNIDMSMRHGAECNNVPKYNVTKCQGVDVTKRRTYQGAALQWTEPTNCRTTYYVLTPPNWAAENRRRKMTPKVKSHARPDQGDQIGRIFAHWALFHVLWAGFRKSQKKPTFWATIFHGKITKVVKTILKYYFPR
jgi:hypothetical protein